jgi:hypothetical protein
LTQHDQVFDALRSHYLPEPQFRQRIWQDQPSHLKQAMLVRMMAMITSNLCAGDTHGLPDWSRLISVAQVQ